MFKFLAAPYGGSIPECPEQKTEGGESETERPPKLNGANGISVAREWLALGETSYFGSCLNGQRIASILHKSHATQATVYCCCRFPPAHAFSTRNQSNQKNSLSSH